MRYCHEFDFKNNIKRFIRFIIKWLCWYWSMAWRFKNSLSPTYLYKRQVCTNKYDYNGCCNLLYTIYVYMAFVLKEVLL